MTVVEVPVSISHFDAGQALIEEARRHQRRRRAWVGVITVIVLTAGTIAWWASDNGSRRVRPPASSGRGLPTAVVGVRLRSTETFCSGKVILKPPTSNEQPVLAARFTASQLPVEVVGALPVPDVVYARVTITDLGPITLAGLRPTYDNAPEWAVIYQNGDFRSLLGPPNNAPHQVGQEVAGGETALMFISPTSDKVLDTEVCPS
jgi:hypothetical protein